MIVFEGGGDCNLEMIGLRNEHYAGVASVFSLMSSNGSGERSGFQI